MGKYQTLLLLVDVHFTCQIHEIFLYLNKKMNIIFFRQEKIWGISSHGESPYGDAKLIFAAGICKSPREFGTVSFFRSFKILYQKALEFTQYGLFLQKQAT